MMITAGAFLLYGDFHPLSLFCLQVGKLSLKWEAEEKTKVIGTYPPVVAQNEKRWTGYVEKDTAGQTNIYAVEVSQEMQAQVFVFVTTVLT
jgi:hypothetical protein